MSKVQAQTAEEAPSISVVGRIAVVCAVLLAIVVVAIVLFGGGGG